MLPIGDKMYTTLFLNRRLSGTVENVVQQISGKLDIKINRSEVR